ncbi:hypothetical protein PV05_02605 [Exophiala xenobiotica]|uniref:Uncharacterized protein n=1 Tax=Exophiala xenobiotica TaxID=348802 RepID=A0A0D2ETI8_9EURO|nr:uncharacterized protein PV05_02605 [Exophiala xenobiotica]KIW58055.1 hypothetical protein PV05_02605 [Exophiala xenobiotica]
MGYWALMWVALVAEEEFIFRRNKGYKCEDWNDPSKLPVGIAGLTAFIIGWVGAVLSMMDGADLGMPVAASLAALIYPPLRYLELKYSKR